MQDQAAEDYTVYDCAEQLIRAALILENVVEKMYMAEHLRCERELAAVTPIRAQRINRWRKHWGR